MMLFVICALLLPLLLLIMNDWNTPEIPSGRRQSCQRIRH